MRPLVEGPCAHCLHLLLPLTQATPLWPLGIGGGTSGLKSKHICDTRSGFHSCTDHLLFKKLPKARSICLEMRNGNRAGLSKFARYSAVSWLFTRRKYLFTDLITYRFSLATLFLFPSYLLNTGFLLSYLDPLTKGVGARVRKLGRLHPRIQFIHQFCLS